MESSRASKIIYQQLPSPFSIRVLKLLPGSRGSSIRCTLETTELGPEADFQLDQNEPTNAAGLSEVVEESLEPGIPYEALSYAWGGASVTTGIEVEGEPFNATRNLESALQYLRYTDRPRTLWVDAVSINQGDLAERGHQVKDMARIFHGAFRVLIWLGEYDADVDLAFRLVTKMAGTSCDDFDRYCSAGGNQRDFVPVEDYHRPPILNPWVISEHELQALRSTFADRTYWHRLWVVQEVISARRAEIICGTRRLSLDVVQDVAIRCIRRSKDDTIHGRLYQTLRMPASIVMQRYFASQHDRAGQTLSYLLPMHADKECLDPRDTTYALVSMSRFSRPGVRPIPDYSKGPLKVRRDTTIAILLEHLKLNPLLRPSPLNRFNREDEIYFSVGGRLINADIWDSSDPQMLRLYGVARDEVTTVGRRLRKHDTLSLEQVVREWEYSLLDAAERKNRGYLKAYCQTLLQDCRSREDNLRRMQHECLTAADLEDAFDLFLTCTGRAEQRTAQDSQNFKVSNRPFADWIEDRLEDYSFFRTQSGLFGLIRVSPSVGDVVTVLYGASTPVLLRPVVGEVKNSLNFSQKMSEEACYQLIGAAYVNDIMDGEVIEEVSQGLRKEKTFFVV